MRKHVAVFFFLISGCVGVNPDAVSSEKIYRKDMRIKINGEKIDGGVYVFERKPEYEIKAYLYRKAQVFKVTSCHREWVFEEPGDDVTFKYIPIEGIENDGYCPLEIGGFDARGQHSWAFIDFVGVESLEAELGCNGLVAKKRGVSVCQSRAGLIQRIEFDKSVKSYTPDRCPQPESKDDITFDITLSANKCIYLFMDQNDNIHRLTTIGYEDVLIRD